MVFRMRFSRRQFIVFLCNLPRFESFEIVQFQHPCNGCFLFLESFEILLFHFPAMDENFFLVKQVDEALFDSQLFLNDQDLYGSMRGVILSNCNKELDEVFDTERNDELLR